jgi:hypothetical protein
VGGDGVVLAAPTPSKVMVSPLSTAVPSMTRSVNSSPKVTVASKSLPKNDCGMLHSQMLFRLSGTARWPPMLRTCAHEAMAVNMQAKVRSKFFFIFTSLLLMIIDVSILFYGRKDSKKLPSESSGACYFQ